MTTSSQTLADDDSVREYLFFLPGLPRSAVSQTGLQPIESCLDEQNEAHKRQQNSHHEQKISHWS